MGDTDVAPPMALPSPIVGHLRPGRLAALVAAIVLACAGVLALRPASAAADCAPGSANCLTGYATNRDGATLTPFDVASNQPLQDVNDNLNDPGPIAITPDGKDAYVANACNIAQQGDGNLTDSVLGSGEYDTFSVSADACFTELAVSPNRNANGDGGYTMWAATPGSEVFPVDTSDHSVGTPVVLPDPCPPSGCVGAQIEDGIDDIVLSPDGNTLYILFTQSTIEGDGSSSSHTYVVPYDLTTSQFEQQIGLYGANLQGSSLAISPAGGTLYATANSCNEFDLTCSISPLYSIPTQNPPTTENDSVGTGLAAAGQITVSPDGSFAYVSESNVILIPGSEIAVAELNTIPAQITTHYDFDPPPQLTAITPDGSELYTGFYDNDVFSTNLVEGVSTSTGQSNASIPITGDAPEGIALTPTQPPTAQLTVNAAVPGKASILDASGSSAPCTQVVCSTIASYHWTFGDGSLDRTTTTPTITHVYSGSNQPYTASVTETTSQGVSTKPAFTGHQMLINGGPSAQTDATFSLPTLRTSASGDVPRGRSVTDTAILAGGGSDAGPIAFSLYGPDDPTCTGTPAFTDTVTANGAGTYTSGSFTPTAMGTYHWTATFSPTNGDIAQRGRCGDANESVTVGKAIPAIFASASGAVTIGGHVHDTAAVSGGDSPTGSVTFSLYGPSDLSCSDAPVATDTVSLHPDGTASSAPVAPATAGVYAWSAAYSGDAHNAPVTGTCGGAGDSVSVARITPTLTTSATATVTLGGQIGDTARLTGGYHPTGQITFRLAGAGDATCSAGPVYTAVVPVTADGRFSSGPFTPLAAGDYRWQASYAGDANNDPVTGPCNATDETSTITAAPPPNGPLSPPSGAPTGQPPTTPGGSPPAGPPAVPPPTAPPPTAPPPESNADVAVRLSGPERETVARPATYVVTVANRGPATARSVPLTDAVTGDGHITRVTGATCRRPTICTLAQLAPGRSAQVRVEVDPVSAGRLTLTSTVRSATRDPRLANNRASATTTIASRAARARKPTTARVRIALGALSTRPPPLGRTSCTWDPTRRSPTRSSCT